MKKRIFVPLALLLSLALNAQSFEDHIRENPLRSANGMYHYEPCTDALTPAPEGYEPFYISHFSRHGSRYPGNSSEKYFVKALRQLDSLEACSALNENGLLLADACHRLYDECSGNWERLTSRGAAEHRGIGSRMLQNFPEVFAVDSIDVYSTTSKRVMLSRDNFLSSLGSLRTNSVLENVSADARQEVKGFIIPDDLKPYDKPDTYPREMLQYRDNALLSSIFFNEGSSPKKYDFHIIRKGLHCLEYCPVLEDYSSYLPAFNLFPVGECIFNAASSANSRLATMGTTAANPNHKQELRGVGIARKVVEDADRAIEERNLAATLRFSHDFFVLVLACVIGVEGADIDCPANEAFRQFESLRFSGMASNMQMVFYSDKKGDVLVKILWSEKEAIVKGLEPVCGVYYRWDELRSHILGRCDRLVPAEKPAVKASKASSRKSDGKKSKRAKRK